MPVFENIDKTAEGHSSLGVLRCGRISGVFSSLVSFDYVLLPLLVVFFANLFLFLFPPFHFMKACTVGSTNLPRAIVCQGCSKNPYFEQPMGH